jgi:peptide/nickel transport system substrate-binding protein
MARFIVIVVLVAAWFSGLASAQAETPTPGGSAIVILGSDPEHLNAGISTGYPIGAVGANLYSALVYLDPDGAPHGELAESWTVSDDNLVYTFTLRPAAFHDGEPLTSADVVYSMEEVLAPNHGRFLNAYNAIASIEAPDDATVVITLEQPYAPLLGLLSVFDAPVLPRHVYEGTDVLTNPANQQPIGSGPFRFVEWVRGERVVLERYDDYFLEPALLDRLVYRIVPQDVARAVALEVGEADLVWGFYMPPADLDRLEADPNIEVWRGLTIPSLYFVFVNTDNPDLADPRVRQALMHAIDREQIVEQAQGGLGEVAAGPFGAGFAYAYSEAADFRDLYPYDPERARELLAEAGVSDLSLDFVYDSARGAFAAAAEIMRDNLRQVGITLNVQPVERSVMVERVYGRQYDLSDAVVHVERRSRHRLPPHLPQRGTRHQLRQRHRLLEPRGRRAAQPGRRPPRPGGARGALRTGAGDPRARRPDARHLRRALDAGLRGQPPRPARALRSARRARVRLAGAVRGAPAERARAARG